MSEAPEIPESSNRVLNRFVATTVVILSVATAINNIKDGNIVQIMQADQAETVDRWNEYQAARIKEQVQQVTTLVLQQNPVSSTSATLAQAESLAKFYEQKTKESKEKAIAARADYDKQGRRDDQFDLGEGFLSIAMAVAAIAALIESFPLLFVSWGAAVAGLTFTVAGFAELPIHPDALVNFLT
jgi:hypothetical protein